MRVLFTTLPGAGPFHSLVPLARALGGAGHAVAFASARSYCPAVEAAGFRCFPAGVDWLVGEREPLDARVRDVVAGRDASFSPLRDVYTAFLPPRMVPDLLALGRAWSPDVLVREPMELAGGVAAECLGLPHSLLLSHCDLVITHGGFSSVMAGLNQGLPMVLIPLAGGDQRGNAERCAALGVGLVVPPDQRTPAAIRAAVLDTLGDPRYRQNAERLRDELQALPGPEDGVALLERLAVEQTPPVALPQ